MLPPRSTVPLLAVSVVAGSAAAMELSRPAVVPALALAGLGVALGGRVGAIVAAAGLGLALTWARDPGAPAGRFPDPERPAVVSGRVQGHWSPDPFGWRAVLRSEVVRQSGRVEVWRRDVRVSVEHQPPPGRDLRLIGYLRPTAGPRNPGAAPRRGWSLRVKSSRWMESGASSVVDRLSRRMRSGFERLCDAAGGRRGPLLARALVLGERSALPPRVGRTLRRAGLSHLLAVSGLHVGLVAAIGLLAGRLLPRPLRWMPGAAGAVGYLLLIGPRPAIVRAAVMALLGTLALLRGRRPIALHALALAAAGMTALQPATLADTGFQLTTAATAGIVLGGPCLARRWSATIWPAAARALGASVAAQLATLPFALPVFHLVTPAAPLLNLVAVPWTAMALLAIVIWTGATSVSPALAEGLEPLLEIAAWPYFALAELPPARLPAVPLVVGRAGATVLAAAVAVAVSRRHGPLLVALAAVGGGLLLAPVRPAPRPELVMFDVGQGESLLLRYGRRTALIDGGGWRRGDVGGTVLVPALAALGVRRLDAVVLSHPDLDHCRGLVDLASYLPVDELWTAPGWRRSDCALRLTVAAGLRLRPLWRGREARLGGWRVRALHPPAGDRSSGNDRSLVLAVETAGARLLLTGDLEARGERRLLRDGAGDLRSDLLKVAHHGSKTSSVEPFLRAVAPRLALISAGRSNPYGHPAPEVVGRLRRLAVPLLRTDRSGQVRISVRPLGGLRVELPAAPG